jgi:hypothetical protein
LAAIFCPAIFWVGDILVGDILAAIFRRRYFGGDIMVLTA